MEYLVIELKDKPRIITKSNVENVDLDEVNDPYIFKDKNSAYRIANLCKQGLVYPICDVMKTLEIIKTKIDNGVWRADFNTVDEIFYILDELV